MAKQPTPPRPTRRKPVENVPMPEAVEPLAPAELDSGLDEADETLGEVSLELRGTEFVLRPSHTACRQIEQGTGKSLIQLAMLAEANAIKIDEAAIIVTACIKAWGGVPSARHATVDKVSTLLFEVGIMAVQPRIELVLKAAATGGVKADGKPKPGEAIAPRT